MTSTPSTTRECCCEDCCYDHYRAAHYKDGRDCICIRPSCPCHTKQTGSDDWERRVAGVAVRMYKLRGHYAQFSELLYQEVKSLLQAERKKVVGEVEKIQEHYCIKGEQADTRIMNGEDTPHYKEIVAVCVAVEKVLDDVLSFLKREGEELTNN